jgi:hypothetical protein
LCDTFSETDDRQCRAVGMGAVDDRCGASGDATCSAGLICDVDHPGSKKCRSPGNGSLGAPCGQVGDATCPFACDTTILGNRNCRNFGTGALGQPCDRPGQDDPCDVNLVCDDNAADGHPTCRAVGAGGEGDGCGKAGDAACGTDLVCDNSGSGFQRCRPVGMGAEGDACVPVAFPTSPLRPAPVMSAKWLALAALALLAIGVRLTRRGHPAAR